MVGPGSQWQERMIEPNVESLSRREKRRFRLATALIVLIPAVLFVALLSYGLFTRATVVEAGARAPSFDLELFAGQKALESQVADDGRLSSQELQGQPVVVNFWASWCIPCREEAPRLERTWRKYRDQGVLFVGINIQDARSDALDFIDEFDVTYPQVRAPGFQTTDDFDVTGVPETFFIGHDWRFVGIVTGAAQRQQGGIRVLGAISEEQLVENVEILIRRAQDAATQRDT